MPVEDRLRAVADGYAAAADEVHLVLTARSGTFEMLLGPLPGVEAERMLLRAQLPLVGPVIARLATSAMTVDGGSHLLIVVDR